MKRATTSKARAAVDELENLFKALADKTRLRILALLGNNEVCVCHIHDSLGLPQPTVSRHLAYLRKSGLVAARRDGVWMHYQVSRSLSPVIQGVVAAAVDALQQLPATTQDRKQFQRSFGQLYVLDSPRRWRVLCAPRAGVAAMIESATERDLPEIRGVARATAPAARGRRRAPADDARCEGRRADRRHRGAGAVRGRRPAAVRRRRTAPARQAARPSADGCGVAAGLDPRRDHRLPV